MAAPILLIIILFLLQVFFVFGNITPTSTLSTKENDAWLSPSHDFALGFRQLNGTNLFMVAIWYNKIPDKTIVWSANANNPAPTGSQLQLTSKGLMLTTPKGESTWIAEPNTIVSYGAMLDSGNFILVNGGSTIEWESFKNPTDTLLPNQYLEPDDKLTSRLTETNYTRGRFRLRFDGGNVLFSPLAWPSDFPYNSYYSIDAFNSTSRLVFDELGDIYVKTTNGSIIEPQGPTWGNLTLDPKVNYYRATLDFHGVFTQYAHPRNSSAQQVWSIVRYVPDNICWSINNEMGTGPCGYNSVCSMENQRPTCTCPYGYSLVDPNNRFGGCQLNFTLLCGADIQGPQARPEELYELTAVREINFPFGDYERIEPSSLQDCQQSCLQDCNCVVAITSGETCWKKRLPLINGRVETGPQFVYIKTRVRPLSSLDAGAKKEVPTVSDSKKEDQKNPILLGSLIGSLVINSILLATLVLVIVLLKPKRILQATSPLETNLHWFPYESMEKATRGFSEEIGRGSFGIVYKGTVESGSCVEVAVKKLLRLDLEQEREKEFKTELSAIGKTCHKNLVRLIGFCDEGTHRLLVYEFMSNGTLADILLGQPKPTWNLRVGFALGIARGLVYLHQECDIPIIHCDIKPQNILIDENFNAKISDFGLAKLLLSDQSRTNTMIRGTRGYVAPEWFKNVPVTVKVDVYSFGVMLLEIICCRKSVLVMESGEEEKGILADWSYDCYIQGRIAVLVESDKEAMADMGRLQQWLKIAIWCIQEHHERRPTMGMVMQMLEGFVDVPNPPSPSSFNGITV